MPMVSLKMFAYLYIFLTCNNSFAYQMDETNIIMTSSKSGTKDIFMTCDNLFGLQDISKYINWNIVDFDSSIQLTLILISHVINSSLF